MNGTYMIIREHGFWCVGKLLTRDPGGVEIYQRVSNQYRFRGWAQAFCRRMKIQPLNY